MAALTHEVRNVQNPALGGILLWRFVSAYSSHHRTSGSPPVPLLFVVLPILFHRDTFDVLSSTNRPSGLHGFADKFSRSNVGMSDVLLGVQSRAASWMNLTWESMRLVVSARLLTISSDQGAVVSLTDTSPSGVPQSIRPLLRNAEKLGEWCSDLSLFEIGTILKVEF